MNLKENISNYIFNHCLEESPPAQFMYGKRPGDRYKYQYYLSRLLYNSNYRFLIAKEFIRLVEQEIGHWNFQIAGREWSAIPLITSLQDNLIFQREIYLNAFMIKSERKKYGIHNYHEGIANKLPVLIVDDLCNSTNSFVHCHNVCKYIIGIETLPFIFAVLNKFNPTLYEDKMDHDKYLGKSHKALYIVDGGDINEARIRNTAKNLIV